MRRFRISRRWLVLILCAGLVCGWWLSRSGAKNLMRPEFPANARGYLSFTCEPAFDALKFWDPLYVTPLPDGSGRLLVVERRGTIQLIAPGPHGVYTKTRFVDLTPRVVLTKDRAEEGLLGLAFHPKFNDPQSPHRGELFVFYVGRDDHGPTNRLSRLKTRSGRLDELDPASEQVLIDQPDEHQSHNAGSLAFGADGFLYVGLGDDNHPTAHQYAQCITQDLFSGIVRLDVDCQGGEVSHPPKRGPKTGRTAGYFIPNDNPFVGLPDALEEFYAIGFRNPWRMSFDPVTGHLYVSDPGDRSREEINLVRKGSNCGWAYEEGTLSRKQVSDDSPGRPDPYLGIETRPLYEYTREAAHRCVIGGYVYRGREFPELVGKYIFADQSGRIYALELLEDGQKAGALQLIATLGDSGIGISSFGQDDAGELFVCSIGELASETGHVHRLRRTKNGTQSPLPETLADTRLFADWRSLTPKEDLVPYEVTVPFWSDGAEKQRWIALSGPEKVTADKQGNLVFPAGTAFVKHFSLATDKRHPDQTRPLETRVLVCDEQGAVFGATYRWSEDGESTRLVSFSEKQTFAITQADGSSTEQTWFFPGRFECAQCHNSASGQVLGFNLKQLNRDIPCPGGQESQIDRLIDRQVLKNNRTLTKRLKNVPHLAPLDDKTASLEHRVRSYLDVNCSVCHNPRQRFAAFDARFERPLGRQGLIEGASFHHSTRGDRVRIVKSGNLDLSMLHLRVSSAEPELRMPPVGSSVVDAQAQAVVADWIRSLPQIPETATAPKEPNVRDDFRR